MTRTTHAIQCIGCPVGCGGEVVTEDGAVLEMRGFTCDKGQAYAAEEVVAPKRMVTTTVRVKGGRLHYLPVVSEKAVPKEKIFDCVRLLRGVEVTAPIAADEVIVGDALGLGIAFRAARPIPAVTEEARAH
jgi:CxxC motif-containing protein